MENNRKKSYIWDPTYELWHNTPQCWHSIIYQNSIDDVIRNLQNSNEHISSFTRYNWYYKVGGRKFIQEAISLTISTEYSIRYRKKEKRSTS